MKTALSFIFFVALRTIPTMTTMETKPKYCVATEQWIPLAEVTTVGNEVILRGPNRKALDILSDKLNFDYYLVRPIDHRWGSPLSDGNWTGMFGMLLRKECDILLGPSVVTWPRAQVSDFAVPVIIDYQSVAIKRPELTNDLAGFLKPFGYWVWSAIVLSLLAVCVALSKISQAEGVIFGFESRATLDYSFFWGIKTLTQEASHWLPQTAGSRSIIVVWLLASLTFMKSYEGILTSMLTVPRIDIPIDSVRDLAHQNEVPWKLINGSAIYTYFQESTTEVEMTIFDKSIGTFQDCFHSRREIINGDFASLCDRVSIRKAMHWDFSNHGTCNMYAAREEYKSITMAYSFRTNSSLLPMANYWLQRVIEAGLFNKWLQDEMVNSTICLLPPSVAGRTVNNLTLKLDSFYGSFLLLLAGIFAGSLCLVLELIVARSFGHHSV